MSSIEYRELTKSQNSLHKRLSRLRKMAKNSKTDSVKAEIHAKIALLEEQWSQGQESLKKIRNRDRKIKGKVKGVMNSIKQAEERKIENTHRVSKLDDQKVTLLQGGSPGLGKRKS